MVRDNIEKEILPNIESTILDHFPNLDVTYKPNDANSFLFAYVLGVLEDAYHKLYLVEGFGRYSDAEYFGIHRIVSEYKEKIKSKINQYIEENPQRIDIFP